MIDAIRGHYDRLVAARFPQLGKRVGDFALWDSLLAGTANSYITGRLVKLEDIPLPDDETIRFADELHKQPSLSHEEHCFLEYFAILEALRHSLELALQSDDPAS